jgi:hypothetical protein
MANPTPTDLEILIDIGCCSDSLSNEFNIVQPNGTDPLAFDFKNDTGGIVTSLTFGMTIKKNLTDPEIASGFSCPQDPLFFRSCDVDYVGSSGALQYFFFGVKRADGDENVAIFPHDT